MRILRYGSVQCFKNINLPRCIVDMIITTNDMTDVHIQIIHYHTKIISRDAITSQQNQIIKLAVRYHNFTLDQIIKDDMSLCGILKADNWLDFGWGGCFASRQRPSYLGFNPAARCCSRNKSSSSLLA